MSNKINSLQALRAIACLGVIICHMEINAMLGIFGNGGVSRTYMLLPASVCLVYLFAIRKGYITKILSDKFLIYFGNISNYTFLIHVPVIRGVIVFSKHILHIDINKGALLIVSLILTIISCELWEYILKYIDGNRGQMMGN